MNNLSKFDLLSNVISLINSEEYISTINSISNSCNVPIQYIRKIILALLNNQIMQSCLFTYNNDEPDDDFDLLESYYEDPDDFSDRLLQGQYDNTEWELNMSILDNLEQEILPLSHLEYGALKSLGEDILSIKRSSIFEKKDTINPISPTVKRNKEILQEAIDEKKAVTFIYKKPNDEKKNIKCYPQNIITNVSDNWIYLQTTDLKLYRIDRILQTCRILSSDDEFPGYTNDPLQKYVWGAFSSKELTPVHIKLRIAPETSNIIDKVRNDTALRHETASLYQDNGFYYYEDDVIGLDELQRWIRGYGSSIIVLEPKELKDAILSRAHETLNLYSKSKEWGDL